jgi:hypothetical protein
MATKLEALRALRDRANVIHEDLEDAHELLTTAGNDLASVLDALDELLDDDDGTPPAAEVDEPRPCARPIAPLEPSEVWSLWPVIPHDARGRALYGVEGRLTSIPWESIS